MLDTQSILTVILLIFAISLLKINTKCCSKIEGFSNPEILRALPQDYNPYQKIFDRKDKQKISPPLSYVREHSISFASEDEAKAQKKKQDKSNVDESVRKTTDPLSIKQEHKTYEMISIANSLQSPLKYYKHGKEIYEIEKIPWVTLYATKDPTLISHNDIFFEVLQCTMDKYKAYHQRLQKSKGGLGKFDPYLFKSIEDVGVPGTNLKYDKLLDLHRQILKMIFYHFILKLNIEIRKKGYDNDYHDHGLFVLTDYKLILIKHHTELNIYQYTLELEVFRHNKNYGYTFYLVVLFRAGKSEIFLQKVLLMGVVMQDQITFNDLGNYHFNKTSGEHGLQGADYSIYEHKLGENVLTHNSYRRIAPHQEGHKCFFGDKLDILESKHGSNNCLSYSKKYGTVGIWDKPCKTNSECPFYKANLNYPNSRGGCIDGSCELPSGMKPIGYKHYTKDLPMCHQCKPIKGCSGYKCNHCCRDQKDPSKYPNLKSPDYVFEKDDSERIVYGL